LKYVASAKFWALYQSMPAEIRAAADKQFALLKSDSRHPSLHFKKVGSLWSARVGSQYRVLGKEIEDGIVWFWIGSHADYDRLVR
jgi:hypothetical protein